jgi:cell division protein FtsX
MPDLEELLRRRQAQLRGRPENWIDRLVAWHHRQDWVGVGIVILSIIGALLAFFLVK